VEHLKAHGIYALGAMRSEIARRIPSRKEIDFTSRLDISVDLAKILVEERNRLEPVLKARDLASILKRYPIRESGALIEIAKRLGFANREQYEAAVRKMLLDDGDALMFIRSFFFSCLIEELSR
jgi:hypothetical protein